MTGAAALRELKALHPVDLHLLTQTFDLGWTGAGKHDFTALDKQVRAMLEADPRGMLLLRVINEAPDDRKAAYPDELLGFADPDYKDQAQAGPTAWKRCGVEVISGGRSGKVSHNGME